MFGNLFNSNYSTAYSEETIDILRLIRSENVGPKTFSHLMKFFGSASKALENIQEFSIKGGKTKPITLYSKNAALKELEELAKNKAHIITFKDAAYSDLLLQIPDFPPVLSYKGNIELLSRPQLVAIVGARNCSFHGRVFATKISKELASLGFVTVSGLARGIDTFVHTSSINNTIAVMAGGIDYIYPPENSTLYHQIAENGLILAELAIGTKPLSQNFPQRNRIISGLALATVVIEAGIKSGSLITANFALEQNREVFAAPGYALEPRSAGGNKLIKEGAHLLESVDDIIANITPRKIMDKPLSDRFVVKENFEIPVIKMNLEITNKHRKAVLSLLSSVPLDLEIIAHELQMELPVLYTICLELELAGKIVRSNGNKISLVY